MQHRQANVQDLAYTDALLPPWLFDNSGITRHLTPIRRMCFLLNAVQLKRNTVGHCLFKEPNAIYAWQT